MFDISFAELMIIMIVGLIVLGPERLPVVARTIGHFLGRAQRYVDSVKSDLRTEIELDNLRKLQDAMHDNISTFENSLTKEISEIQKSTDISRNTASKSTVDTNIEQKTTRIATPDHAVSQPKSPMADSDTTSASRATKK
ncbi:MAG: Sec-independent protein translocase protein TatB [Nitrosomonas sp.]|nr:Sec-independent protein translocase protein TatB [Nitrosomonas sp.]